MPVADFARAGSDVDGSRRQTPWLERARNWLDDWAVRGRCQDTHIWASKTELLRTLRTTGPQAL